jgi:hypothetical protein
MTWRSGMTESLRRLRSYLLSFLQKLPTLVVVGPIHYF